MRAWWIAPVGLGLTLMTAGCGQTQGQQATTGALGGVAFGAAVGGPIGALVGGAAGAVAGAERPAIDQTVNTGSQKAQAAVNSAVGDINGRTASAGPAPGTATMANAGGTNASGSRADLTHQEVRQAQTTLKHLGLYTGPIDGIYGPQTLTGVKRFQARNGLPQTGALTGVTERRLQASANPQNPQNQPQAAQAPSPADNGNQNNDSNLQPQTNGPGTNSTDAPGPTPNH